MARVAALGGLEIPHDQQQSQIVLLASHQDRTKQGQRWSHSTWSLDKLWAAFLWVFVDCSSKDLLRQSFLGDSGHMAELTYLGSLNSEKWLYILSFTDFRPVLFVTKCHTENSSQISHLCHLFFWQYSFSRHLRFMTTGEDRDKDRFKNWNLCVFSKLPFGHHGAIKLMRNCVCFTNPCINRFFRLPSLVNTTPRYLNVSTCCSVFPFTCRKHCLGRLKRHNTLYLFRADSRSCLVAHSRKRIKCVLKTLLRKSIHAPIRPQKAKQTVHSAVPNTDNLADASVTVY